MTLDALAKPYNKAGFATYLHTEIEDRFLQTVWRPRGVVLHNTGKISGTGTSVENFYQSRGKPLDGAQRVKNMWQTYINNGWYGGPHLIITDVEIFTGNPLWKKGTHSPSWNSTFWGLEMVGDYDFEKFPPALRDLTTYALAALYDLLGHEPTNDTFHLHKEDPLTSHKRCPGKNAGPKSQWIADVRATMAAMRPGGHTTDEVASA
jgi:hypothetical protein